MADQSTLAVILRLAILLLCGCLSDMAAVPLPALRTPMQRLTVAWDPSSSADVVRYAVYWGTNGSRNYTQQTNVWGTQATIAVARRTNWIAATAIDGWGLESDFSVELVYAPPSRTDTNIVVRLWARVSESEDLRTWTTNQVMILALTNPVGNRFWRVDGAVTRTNY